MHLPSLSEVLVFATGYVTGCSIAVNVLPKDTVFDAYPRVKSAYGAFVLVLAVSAFNIRRCLPGADVKIPGLGFGQYERDHPELFGGQPLPAQPTPAAQPVASGTTGGTTSPRS